MPCMCEDSECPSCGLAQGTLAPKTTDKYGEPWVHGHQTEFALRHPDQLYDRDGEGVVMVYGIPSNCTMAELESDPRARWQVGLARAKRIKDVMNALAGMDPSDIPLMVKLLRAFVVCIPGSDAAALLERLPQ